MRYRSSCLAVLLLLTQVGTRQAPQAATLAVEVSGINAVEGTLLYTVFNQAEGFPDKPEKAYKWGKVQVTGNTQRFSIEDLPPGRYAVGIVHDANRNQRCDTNWLGVPTEGFGFSNNAKPRWNGPPRFESAAFALPAGGTKQTIPLQY